MRRTPPDRPLRLVDALDRADFLIRRAVGLADHNAVRTHRGESAPQEACGREADTAVQRHLPSAVATHPETSPHEAQHPYDFGCDRLHAFMNEHLDASSDATSRRSTTLVAHEHRLGLLVHRLRRLVRPDHLGGGRWRWRAGVVEQEYRLARSERKRPPMPAARGWMTDLPPWPKRRAAARWRGRYGPTPGDQVSGCRVYSCLGGGPDSSASKASLSHTSAAISIPCRARLSDKLAAFARTSAARFRYSAARLSMNCDGVTAPELHAVPKLCRREGLCRRLRANGRARARKSRPTPRSLESLAGSP